MADEQSDGQTERSVLQRMLGADASTDGGVDRVERLIRCLSRYILLPVLAVVAILVMATDVSSFLPAVTRAGPWVIPAAIAGSGVVAGFRALRKRCRQLDRRRRPEA